MPLYEYHCDACGRQFELIRKFSDPPLEKCPHCGSTVRKLFSSPAIQFKGSGFYITDYAKKDQTPASPSGESKSDTASKDQEKGATGEKSEKIDKSETTAKSDKGSSTTDATASSSSSTKDSTGSTQSTKDSTKSKDGT